MLDHNTEGLRVRKYLDDMERIIASKGLPEENAQNRKLGRIFLYFEELCSIAGEYIIIIIITNLNTKILIGYPLEDGIKEN